MATATANAAGRGAGGGGGLQPDAHHERSGGVVGDDLGEQARSDVRCRDDGDRTTPSARPVMPPASAAARPVGSMARAEAERGHDDEQHRQVHGPPRVVPRQAAGRHHRERAQKRRRHDRHVERGRHADHADEDDERRGGATGATTSRAVRSGATT